MSDSELRALVYQAFDARGTPEFGGLIEKIVEWKVLRSLPNMDFLRCIARGLLQDELDRQGRIPTVDALVELLRRTEPTRNGAGLD